MRGAIPLLPQYTFIAWCSVKEKAQGQLYILYITLNIIYIFKVSVSYFVSSHYFSVTVLSFLCIYFWTSIFSDF